MPSFRIMLCGVFLIGVAFIGTGSWASGAAASTSQLTDDFQSYPTGDWPESSTHGPWNVVFNGYGGVGIATDTAGTNQYHYQKPMASTTPGETHASMVVSNDTFNDIDMTMQQRTVKQLRTGSTPNPWEVAWTVWGYSDNQHFYYFIFKPEGIELGKENPGYPGAQRYLYTATNPKMTIGTWNTIRVRQVNATIDVWVNGVQVIKGFVDRPGPAGDQPYTGGKIGMYEEDAYVNFDNVSVANPHHQLSEPQVSPSSPRANTTFGVSGYINPQASSSSTPLYFFFYYPGYGWYYYGKVDATNSPYDANTTKYSANYVLPFADYWLVLPYDTSGPEAAYNYKVFIVS